MNVNINNISWIKIGKRIESERKNYHFSAQELSEKIGISRQTLRKWETGEGVEIPLGVLVSLCNIFDCEMGYLLCEDGYEMKTRTVTDIHAHTGLSRESIDKIQKIKDPALINIMNLIIEHPEAKTVLQNIHSASECKESRAEKIRNNWNDDLKNLYDSLPEEEYSFDKVVSTFSDYSDKYAIVERSKLSPMYIQETSRIMGIIAGDIIYKLWNEGGQ